MQWRWVFFVHFFSCNIDDQLSQMFYRLVILCIRWDSWSEDSGIMTIAKTIPCLKGKLVNLYEPFSHTHLYKQSVELYLNYGPFPAILQILLIWRRYCFDLLIWRRYRFDLLFFLSSELLNYLVRVRCCHHALLIMYSNLFMISSSDVL